MEVKHLKIAVCGQTTPGKKLICNGLLGKEIIQEGDWEADNTSCVNSIPNKVPDKNMETTICYVHGFDASLNNVTADQYISEVKDHCLDADLLLYCIEIEKTSDKFLSDRETLKQLKLCLNSSVWDHCIFVLIFPNPINFKGDIIKRSTCGKTDEAYIEEWTGRFKSVLKNIGISNKPNILTAGDAVAFSLLDNKKYWLSDLYGMAKGLVGEMQRDVLIQLNAHRCMIESEVKIKFFDEEDITRQPIVVSDGSEELKKDIATGTAIAVGVGTATGAVGAGIGATIGALAIGIPTFGVAAGAGLVLGGAIGGMIGVIAGGGSFGFWKGYKNRGRNRRE